MATSSSVLSSAVTASSVSGRLSVGGGGGAGRNAGGVCTGARPGYGGGGFSDSVDGFSDTADGAGMSTDSCDEGDTLTTFRADRSYGGAKLTDELMTVAGVMRHRSDVTVSVTATS